MAKGSIEKRGDNTWRLTVDLGTNPDGTRNRPRKTVTVEDKALLKTTKKLRDYLEDQLHIFKQEVESGEYIKPAKMTFASFVEEWRSKYASKNLAFKTLYTYESNLKVRIVPALGHMKLEDIKPLHIADFLEKLTQEGASKKISTSEKKEGLSSGSVEVAYRILKNIFTRAVKWQVVKSNPVAAVDKPKVQYKEYVPYDENEVALLLNALQNEPYTWRMMITLALTTGMRRSELLGLEWKHVDWKAGVLDISQTMVHALKGNIIFKEPKTKKSKRKISLPSSIVEELRAYTAHQAKERDKYGSAWKGCKDKDGNEYRLVFCHDDGTPFHHERPYLWFRAFLKKHKLRYIRFHDLRHTSATILINQGVHAKVISERFGHGDISTTMNVYGHVLRTADQAAADKFDNILNFKPAPNSSPNTNSNT
ncbi:site-specific integrase [Paenibacillus sp. MY03]|uniref:tyrosine-type recombinase/integrase n=1 Tax=Paenibacillus sp. MY03 TaxID=302980 RepID=UPI000B3CACE3|nr:tyrosine-type recombinase/integrase [Paenibacillus sp. MY03]OUS70269.1 site-specific integrase [Paenibacillus sp. MY03]